MTVAPPFNTLACKVNDYCYICMSPLGASFFDLGYQTLANNLVDPADLPLDEDAFPLQLVQCGNCGLVQLHHEVSPDVLFSHYLYTPSQSPMFHAHFEQMVNEVMLFLGYPEIQGTGLWLDIGSNDGLLLSKAKAAGWRIIGVEPAKNLAIKANAEGVPTVEMFWSDMARRLILGTHSKAQVITATNVFAHVNDVREFVKNVGMALADNGVFIFEVPFLETMLKDGTFDLIYHEHLRFYHYEPLRTLFEIYDMYISKVEFVKIHGGSLRVYVQKGNEPHSVLTETSNLDKRLRDFAVRAKTTRAELIDAIKIRGKVVGYGAPAKATVLINYCGFDANDIEYIVDDNPLKQGMLLPGSRIPVVSSEHLREDSNPPNMVVIFPWNVADDIAPKVREIVPNAEILVPMPDVHLLEE